MVPAGPSASDPLAEAVAWIDERGVRVARWPPGPSPSNEAVTDGPVLYLVDPGASPPARWDELEDWVRLPAEREELLTRADRLLWRATQAGSSPPHVDDDDVLHVGDQIAVLSALGARLVRVLLASPGRVVERDHAVAAMWPDGPPGDPRALDNRLKVLRHRMASLPLRIHTVRGRGLLLEWRPPE